MTLRMHIPNLSEVTGDPSSLGSMHQALRGICQAGSIGRLTQQAVQKHSSGHAGHPGQRRSCRIAKRRACFPKDPCKPSDVRLLGVRQWDQMRRCVHTLCTRQCVVHTLCLHRPALYHTAFLIKLSFWLHEDTCGTQAHLRN